LPRLRPGTDHVMVGGGVARRGRLRLGFALQILDGIDLVRSLGS
jgi:hypothetical protein